MDISIVIPVFNESGKIRRDIQAAVAFLKDNDLEGEIIVADDGSTDGTAKVAEETNVAARANLKVICLPRHKGKGRAVREGITQTTGAYVLFCDSGGCTGFSEALKAMQMLKEQHCDIAHASRRLKSSTIITSASQRRRICSLLFRWFVITFMKIPGNLTDTQCGFKMYPGEIARELYSQSFCDGFMFDIEIILRALKKQYPIKEFPIQWSWDRDTRFQPIKSLPGIVLELIRIKVKL